MADMELTGGHLKMPQAFRSFDDFATAMKPAMWQVGYLLQNDMAHYPPPKPTSNRDGTLGRKWTVEVKQRPGEIATEIGNDAGYAPWVQSHQFQAWMHRGYWQTDQQVLNQRASDIIVLLNNRIIFISKV